MAETLDKLEFDGWLRTMRDPLENGVHAGETCSRGVDGFPNGTKDVQKAIDFFDSASSV